MSPSASRRDSKPQHDRADADLVAVGERNGSRDRLAAQKRPVLAAQILERRAARRNRDARVPARHGRRIQPDAAIVRSRPRMFSPDRSGIRLPIPDQPAEAAAAGIAGKATESRDGSSGLRPRFAAERVAESMRGADEPRLPRGVAERLANFRDQAGEVGLGHERRRPQVLVQLVLRQGAWTLVDQQS